jgi:outer membrane receptor protein involved in Fe transport
MLRICAIIMVVLGTLIALWQPLQAQQSARTGSIRCKVIDAQGLQALPGATIRVLGSTLGAIADDDGLASMTALPTGPQSLVVSYLGYTADTVLVDVEASKVQALEVYLRMLDLEIPGLEIAAGTSQGLSLVHRLDMQLRPVSSSQELLRTVPGLFIAQHAGGGKAEQIFLRGFDIDHGTDLALTADGMPVNMVSHAHGQGYADLHFLIPETVERLAIDKGPYAPQSGNLATAGSIDFQTRNALDRNLLKVEGGMYNNYRALAMLKLSPARAAAQPAHAWLATEYTFSQGYFESPQNLHRLNIFAKYRRLITRKSLLTASVSDFRSQWNASGQIPARAVAQGLITPWGSIDPTEGGATSRSNVNLQLSSSLGHGWTLRQQAYGSRNAFDLYSNFTFYAHDSVHGDQIRQLERRRLYGYQATVSHEGRLLGQPLQQELGAGTRWDDVRSIGLYRTVQRQLIGSVQDGALRERNAFAWAHARWALTDRLYAGGTVRLDYLRFAYDDHIEAQGGWATADKAIVNPRLSMDYYVSGNLQLFVKAGSGFHSNDTRVVLGAPGRTSLPRAWGCDVGALFKPVPQVLVQVALWGLESAQEFVYVGDEGIVEPSGRSRRLGCDLSARWQPTTWLTADVDLNVARPRGYDEVGVAQYIPLAPALTSTGGLTAESPRGFKASLRYRLLGDRAADEAWTLTADGYCLVDAATSYTFSRGYTVGLSGQNLLNATWKEAQFATTSRLLDEPMPVTEIHYTPGAPLALKLFFSYDF